MLNRNTPLELATSRYAARDLIVASGLAPVRITLGAPRFRLGYELAGSIPELAPSPRIFRWSWERFAAAYVKQLDALDWRAIEGELAAIAVGRGADGCVCLCFEDVIGGANCHRRLVAGHWRRRTGADVAELATTSP